MKKKPIISRDKNEGWIRKCDLDELEGTNLPLPTQVVSNEEFHPLSQTAEQQRVEHGLLELADRNAKRPGVSRREFLQTTGGMATAFVAMNTVFGHFFEVTLRRPLRPTARMFMRGSEQKVKDSTAMTSTVN